MKICVIGTGYVGLVAGTCFAEMGNDVICIDNDRNKLEKLQQGVVPIYEPGLEELIKINVSEGRLTFSSDLAQAIQASSICFIAVGTPQGADGSAELNSVYKVAEEIGKNINGYKIIVNKSTVPVGTAEKLELIIKQYTNEAFDIVSNPEFLKQGTAVDDFLKPDRVIIGSHSDRAIDIIKELYAPFVRTGNPIIVMDVKSSELTKYAANAFLALKISFINQMANICEKLGADVDMIRAGMSSDKRIGNQFLFAGLGFGGSCFPKDISALIKIAMENDCDYSLFKVVRDINDTQRQIFLDKIFKRFNNNVKGKRLAVWGLSFKPKTNDMREAPSVTIINKLLNAGANICVYDPKATENAKIYFGEKIIYAKSSNDALKNADALLLLTEWNEFRHPDFEKIKNLMSQHIIFDGRNQYDGLKLQKQGFEYYCIGKQTFN